MRSPPRNIIALTEYQPQTFLRDSLPKSIAETLWRDYRPQISVEYPSFMTNNQWRLTAQGWVGFIPIASDWGISLLPKVPLNNLFGMLEYAYELQSLHLGRDLYPAQSLDEFYARLALILAQRILNRCRQGIYYAYVEQYDRLPYLRGQLDVCSLVRQPVKTLVPCHYEEYTADIEDNQILGWALHRILHSGLCPEPVRTTVRTAYRTLLPQLTLQPYTVHDCRNRRYHRLNADYAAMHALCAFFLSESGPSHLIGDKPMLPFLVDMAHLYERFVAAWLKQHIGNEFRVVRQERHPIGEQHFAIDLVVYEEETDNVHWVMDTKYKIPDGGPDTLDIAQVVAYAEAKGAPEAILIYPTALPRSLDERIGQIRVRSLTFALMDDLKACGQRFMEQLVD